MVAARRWLVPFTTVCLLCAAVVVANAQDGRIEYVEGDVWIESEGERVLADFGSPVRRGELVVTGGDGLAIVSVTDRAQIKLRENTVVALDDMLSGGTVDLRQGGIFARVNRAAGGGERRGFQVRTPTSVAGVRGTEFFVAYGKTVDDRPDVWLCVNEGSVEIAIRDVASATIVEAGEGVNILAGVRATDPRFYPWTTELNWNFDPDAGDVRDATDLDAAYSDLLDQDYD